METERLKHFFDLSLSLLCTADAETGYFVDLNPAWEATLGWTVEELLARPFVEFIHPDDLAPTFAIIEDMVQRGLSAVNFENRYQHKDGHWVWLSWVGVVRDGTFYSSAHDITLYKATLAKLEQANDELQQFNYAVSHDLREPLRAITGHLGVVETVGLPEDVSRTFSFVDRAASRMKAMLDSLNDYLEIDRVGGALSPVDMKEPLLGAIESLHAAIAESSALIEIEGHWPSLAVDAAQISEVFQNLLANSIKYRKAGEPARITVSARPESMGWRFAVEDEGIGFKPERGKRAFLMFQRLHRRSEYEGMGVGLALVKRIVLRHGGQVGITSEPDRGTEAWFWLPGLPEGTS